MHLFSQSLIMTILFSCCNHVLASEPIALEGTYFVSPQYYIDAIPGAKNTHYRMVLKGQSAKELYELMETNVRIDPCTQVKSKVIDSMKCLRFENSRGYECSFSIDVKNQKIDFGIVC